MAHNCFKLFYETNYSLSNKKDRDFKKTYSFGREEMGCTEELEYREIKIKGDESVGKEPTFNKFEPGAIHKKEFREFWENVLKADAWVLQTLEKGYMIPFRCSPTKVNS